LLVRHKLTGGITFTGSHEVGLGIVAAQSAMRRTVPVIAEMGGKNAAIVTRNADLDCAATGIVRSAFGMQGQKCSALSRLYVDDSVADALIENLTSRISALTIGDPTAANIWLGPVATAKAYDRFAVYSRALESGGSRILMGGKQLRTGELAHGFYCAPTLTESPGAHPLWNEEMFCPILMLRRVGDREEAMALPNDSAFGLTAGFYGAAEEVAWFFEHIEAGVAYANRAQGATTGAWPGTKLLSGGRARAQPARQSRLSIICRSTCANNRRRTWCPDGLETPFSARYSRALHRRRPLLENRQTPWIPREWFAPPPTLNTRAGR
jgi:acyl-CoA reductase-like NAD-dependent aldehyde dehydrogenase